jgi:hypothetical protein
LRRFSAGPFEAAVQARAVLQEDFDQESARRAEKDRSAFRYLPD